MGTSLPRLVNGARSWPPSPSFSSSAALYSRACWRCVWTSASRCWPPRTPSRRGRSFNKEDLARASVSSDLTTLVRADQIDQVVGRTARVEISKGQLLDTSQLATNPVPGGDLQVVGVSVNAGRFPAGGFQPGDKVDIVDIGSQNVIVSDAQVLAAKPSSGTKDDWTSGAVVSVIVDKKNAAKLASSSANGTIAVVLTATGQPIKDS